MLIKQIFKKQLNKFHKTINMYIYTQKGKSHRKDDCKNFRESGHKVLQKKIKNKTVAKIAAEFSNDPKMELEIEAALEEQQDLYNVRLHLSEGNRYYGAVWSETSGISFTTKTYTKKKNAINDMLIFIKLFLDFTMGDGKSEIIKNIKSNKTEVFDAY